MCKIYVCTLYLGLSCPDLPYYKSSYTPSNFCNLCCLQRFLLFLFLTFACISLHQHKNLVRLGMAEDVWMFVTYLFAVFTKARNLGCTMTHNADHQWSSHKATSPKGFTFSCITICSWKASFHMWVYGRYTHSNHFTQKTVLSLGSLSWFLECRNNLNRPIFPWNGNCFH